MIEAGIVDRERDSIAQSLEGPLANDMSYTPYTDSTLRRLSALRPATLATMHGSSFHGDGGKALDELAAVIKDLLGRPHADG